MPGHHPVMLKSVFRKTAMSSRMRLLHDFIGPFIGDFDAIATSATFEVKLLRDGIFRPYVPGDASCQDVVRAQR